MKKSLYGIVFCISIILSACSQTRYIQEPYEDAYYDEPSSSISYQQFYNDLDPYGQWINNAEFGSVWVPRLSGFRPYYSNGHWAYTNYGWTWVSSYNWGWAPFHYGRWYYDDFYGWAWVPGYQWAPAWVNWRSNSQYYGWAPLCPQGRDGRYYQIRNDQWNFIPQQYINRRDLNNYYVKPQNNITIINNTTEINKVRVINNNTKYQEGPNVAEVEKVTKTRIAPLAVKQSSVPGETKIQNGAVRIFKPVVKESNITAEKATGNIPSRIIERKNAATIQPQTPQTDVKTVSPQNRVTRKFGENSNQVNVKQPEANNAVTNDDNVKPSTPVINKTRQFQNEQGQPIGRPNTNKIKPINRETEQVPQENKVQQQVPQENKIQRQIPQENRSNINVPERRRPVVSPRKVAPREINQQQRIRNEQPQNRSINQRVERENRAPVYRPSNTFENRPRPSINNSPVQQPTRQFNAPRVRER